MHPEREVSAGGRSSQSVIYTLGTTFARLCEIPLIFLGAEGVNWLSSDTLLFRGSPYAILLLLLQCPQRVLTFTIEIKRHGPFSLSLTTYSICLRSALNQAHSEFK